MLAKDGFVPLTTRLVESCHSLTETSTTDGLSLTFCQDGTAPTEYSSTYVLAAGVPFGSFEKGDRRMEMLLMGVVLAVFGLAVSCMAFGAATRDVPAEAKPVKAAVADARFFAATPTIPVSALNRIPIEALLLQIENHVRLEQAAAECYLQSPNPSLLHSRTVSTLVN
ncbi:MAG TPA: hypothetical protein VGH38_28000 [Bryobacteraceae bacterium]